jgi:hypothetical protein
MKIHTTPLRLVALAVIVALAYGVKHRRSNVRVEAWGHNIDLAARVPVAEADRVDFRGRYERNEKGGVVHWTHHDPRGQHSGGWIRHQGELYK